MRVAVMYSGGKDSCQSLKWALDNGHEIVTLISVKPKSTESFLYQYATVEWTKLSSEAVGIPVIHIKSEKIGPREEAEELEAVFSKLGVDRILVGGVGLQATQIREWRRVAGRFGIELMVPYENMTSEELLNEEIKAGFDIRITSVASDGLGPEWLGEKLNSDNLEKWLELSKKFGFDCLGEGGYMDSFICDAPFFKKKIEFKRTEKIWDNKTNSGYLEVKKAVLTDKLT